MHRSFGLIFIFSFLVSFSACTTASEQRAANTTGTEHPTKAKFTSTGEGERPRFYLNASIVLTWRPFKRCDPSKSCRGRCTLNREFQIPGDKEVACFCDPSCDSVFHDCCFDYSEHCNASFMKEKSSINELDSQWKCSKVNDNSRTIWTVGKCNPGWKDNKIATKCTTPNTREVSTQIPVVDSNNVTFRNRYCAICNKVRSYEAWNFKIKCDAEPASHYTEEESWQFTDYFCKSQFLRLSFSRRGIRYCYDVIQACKNTSSDQHKRNCAQRPTGLVAEFQIRKNYKNFDCFLCSSEYQGFLICGPFLHILAEANKIRPYSAIFTSSTDNTYTSYSRCPTTQIYDARSGVCSELFEKQVEKYSQVKIFAILLKYEASENKTCAMVRGMEARFNYVFDKLLKISLIEENLEFSNLKIYKQNDSIFAVTFQLMGLKEDLQERQDVLFDYSKIEKLNYHASFNKDKNHGICQYFLTERVTREMICVENATFIMTNTSKLLSNGTLQVSSNLTQSNYNKGEFLKYNESFWAVCKTVKPSNCSYLNVLQNATDFILFPNRTIYSYVSKSVFDYGEYSIIDSKVWTCLNIDQVRKANSFQVHSTSVHTTILSYVTLISLAVSIQSLCALIIVYSSNKSLRNLPGKNLMLLCGTLAVAQTLWFIEGNINTVSVWCTIVTIASHLAFLCSFCSSGSIAFHSLLTFRRLAKGKLYNANNTREFPWYCAYAIGLPSCWVSVCWILNEYQVISLRNETSNSCWFGNFKGFTIAFLYPAALQLFVNTSLFLVTLRQIQKCNKSSDQLQKKNGTMNERHVGIYLRMSTLMGLSWLFGILVVAFPGVVVFEYLFVFGNGFQGLYIALAFLSTKNVKKIMLKKLTKSTARSASQTLPNSATAQWNNNSVNTLTKL